MITNMNIIYTFASESCSLYSWRIIILYIFQDKIRHLFDYQSKPL
nr:MAG TPA: hypothetical protein [Caudoviricetes sp.]